MQLNAWINENVNGSVAIFAQLISASAKRQITASMVRDWLNGSIPTVENMHAITKVTKRKVNALDFFNQR